jgi:hypothetical protein
LKRRILGGMREVFILMVLHVAGLAQGLRFLGEVGHVGPPFDQRTFANVGLAKVSPGDAFPVTGVDDAGKRWRADVPVWDGIGWTDAWSGDFDGNGRLDLMLANYVPRSGRCVDIQTITFLMFDDRGRPVPWTIHTAIPEGGGQGKNPAIFDGRSRIIAMDCAYSDPSGDVNGVDRAVTGVYEAQNGHWKLVRSADLGLLDRVLRQYAGRGVHLRPVDPQGWMDHGNAGVQRRDVRVAGVMPIDKGCAPVRLPVENGRVVRQERDPCEVLGKNRLVLSTGETCFGWPTVVIDRASGRDMMSEDSPLIEAELRRLARAQIPVTVFGRRDAAECSPVMLWASDGAR